MLLRGILLLAVLASGSALRCYRCRTNICTHSYCREANKLLETSNTTVNPALWPKLPDCPTSKITNRSKYVDICPAHAIGCGHLIFNITVSTSQQIVLNGTNPVVAVDGPETSLFKSAVIVYGCVLPQYQSCFSGHSKTFNVTSKAQVKAKPKPLLTKAKVTNTASDCCHCQGYLCNGLNDTNSCRTSNLKPTKAPTTPSNLKPTKATTATIPSNLKPTKATTTTPTISAANVYQYTYLIFLGLLSLRAETNYGWL